MADKPSDDQQIPHISEGIPYPQDYVAAAIDRPEDAERAAEALRQAGFGADEVVVMHSDQVVENLQFRQEHLNILERMLAEIKKKTTDEGLDEKRYEAEAKRGASIINVYAPDDEQVRRATEILSAHGAHHINHFGRWAVEDLTPRAGV